MPDYAPRMDFRRLLSTSTIAFALAGLLVSGCSSGRTPPSTPAGVVRASQASQTSQALKAVPSPGLTSYYGQKLTWHPCGAPGFECSTMKVPFSYQKPMDGDIKLAVSRKKATGPGKRIGSLLVNPGGPGSSAIQYLQGYAGIGYPAAVRARDDMVAVDPRGVAHSQPVECLTDRQMDAYTQVDETPDNNSEIKKVTTSFKDYARSCEKHSAKILPHVSTVEAARDMDVLRAVLGDKKLHYVGASYGTLLGATYAGLFPDRVGRMVLDGAMDPSLSSLTMNRDQTAGFETAFKSFATDCITHKNCPIGTKSVADASRRMESFFASLDAKPIPTGQSRKLTESLGTTGVISAMYDEASWPQLHTALSQAMSGNGAGLLALSDAYFERASNGSYANLMAANAAVNCLDLPPAFSGPAAVKAALPSFKKASPVFGEGFAWAALNCAYWPVHATGTPHRIVAKGAVPIVVVGTLRDPATPYKWAKSLAAQLDSGTLLDYDGDGHTAYGRGSDCIDTAINTYLLEGTPPKNGKRCS